MRGIKRKLPQELLNESDPSAIYKVPANAVKTYRELTEGITTEYDNKKGKLDFKRRLIAKFEIPTRPDFWGEGFSSIPESVLYPKNDRIEELCKGLKSALN